MLLTLGPGPPARKARSARFGQFFAELRGRRSAAAGPAAAGATARSAKLCCHERSVRHAPRDRVWTIPNALSVLRLLGVPLFLWLILRPAFHGPRLDGWAILVLILAGLTDYLDGKIARAFNQTSRIGTLLDPAADRLYILATLVGLAWRDIIPIWLVVILVGRDLLMGIPLGDPRRHGYGPPPVHFMGKAATFNLLYAFPLLLLGDGHDTLNDVAGAIGWAFAIWGTTLYWLAAGLYVLQVARCCAPRRTAELERPRIGGRIRERVEGRAWQGGGVLRTGVVRRTTTTPPGDGHQPAARPPILGRSYTRVHRPCPVRVGTGGRGMGARRLPNSPGGGAAPRSMEPPRRRPWERYP